MGIGDAKHQFRNRNKNNLGRCFILLTHLSTFIHHSIRHETNCKCIRIKLDKSSIMENQMTRIKVHRPFPNWTLFLFLFFCSGFEFQNRNIRWMHTTNKFSFVYAISFNFLVIIAHCALCTMHTHCRYGFEITYILFSSVAVIGFVDFHIFPCKLFEINAL